MNFTFGVTFGQDAFDSAHERGRRILERLEDGAKEFQHFVVARLSSPNEALVDPLDFYFRHPLFHEVGVGLTEHESHH